LNGSLSYTLPRKEGGVLLSSKVCFERGGAAEGEPPEGKEQLTRSKNLPESGYDRVHSQRKKKARLAALRGKRRFWARAND